MAFLSADTLVKGGMIRAAHWLKEHGDQWTSLQEKIPEIEKDAEDKGIKILYWGEASYPQRLNRLSYPPAILFVKGNQDCFTAPAVALVGARSPTHLGRLWVEAVVPPLVAEGFTIVSGGARGIDSEAHCAALESHGSTIAVLPGGLDSPYPRSNDVLFDKIVSNGALVSEYPCGTQVRGAHFHRRNRIIAGLADAVVIVEAARKSGTSITATWARDENIDVLVVPGPPMIDSYEGSLDLIWSGAGLARDHHDIVDAIRFGRSTKKML